MAQQFVKPYVQTSKNGAAAAWVMPRYCYLLTNACGLRHVLASALDAHLGVLDSYMPQDLVKRPAALQFALSGAFLLPAWIEKRRPATQTEVWRHDQGIG